MYGKCASTCTCIVLASFCNALCTYRHPGAPRARARSGRGSGTACGVMYAVAVCCRVTTCTCVRLPRTNAVAHVPHMCTLTTIDLQRHTLPTPRTTGSRVGGGLVGAGAWRGAPEHGPSPTVLSGQFAIKSATSLTARHACGPLSTCTSREMPQISARGRWTSAIRT